jgi:fructose-1,6-bisphosphatase I
MKQLITIEEHFLKEQEKFSDITSDLTHILYDINLAAKVIRSEVIRFGLTDQGGRANVENASGEDVQKLDVFANETVKGILGKHGRFAVMGSEEEESYVACDSNGDYVILFDPLDGSSNIDVNISVGTIFSIYKCSAASHGNLEDCLQKGAQQIAAGYVVYGSSVMMVYTAGNGVFGFTYDPSLGDFFLSHDNIKIPKKAKCYSLNDANYSKFQPEMKRYVEWLRDESGATARYVGSLVADFHRNLLKGGIYIYPATSSSPNGKLRLLYEANPLAFICEQAGGLATDGNNRILDIKPTELHQRVPLFIGNKDTVNYYSELKRNVVETL